MTFFNGFWPFNAKIRVASGEEYWGPLKNRHPCFMYIDRLIFGSIYVFRQTKFGAIYVFENTMFGAIYVLRQTQSGAIYVFGKNNFGPLTPNPPPPPEIFQK